MLESMTDTMLVLFRYLLLFSVGTVCGCFIELLWRRFVSGNKRWINPGFLQGPWVPLYGFGSILLYMLSSLPISLYALALVFLVGLTLLEYIAGIIFIGHFKIKLWDYSGNRGNIQGIICPLYSVLWTLLGMFFYFVVYPLFQSMIINLYEYLYLSFFLGIYAGIFAVDVWQSFDVAGRIRTFVMETEDKWLIDFESLKLELRDRVHIGFKNRTQFFFPFRGELGVNFKDNLMRHTRSLSSKLKPIQKVLNTIRENDERRKS